MVSLHRNQNYVCYHVLIACFVLSVIFVAHVAEGKGTFGYDIHHRYSDAVKKILGSDGLPEKDTVEYFAALIHGDHLRGRRLAGTDELTFSGGNLTARFVGLGRLQYVYVTVGTPGVKFLVALDSGSDLFWVPCECTDCPRSITLSSGPIDFNIYTLNGSSTMTHVTCTSPTCGLSYFCLKDLNYCGYESKYLAFNTSSVGVLLQDVLQLRTNNNPSTLVKNTNIPFGCGLIQSGEFLKTTAVNGLLGLGMGDISVPSILASKGLTANSFSFCTGTDALGRIVFGDEGSSDQTETPFSISISQPNYIVSIEEVTIGTTVSPLEFTALVDTGLAFPKLSDPVYTTFTKSFDSQVLDTPITITNLNFDYCYELSSTAADPKSPNVAFTMSGGGKFDVRFPIVTFSLEGGGDAYCLAVLKSTTKDNIIGLRFLVGQKLIFNREKNVLGWKPSNCYGNDETGSNGAPTSSPTPRTPSPTPIDSNPPPPPRSPPPPRNPPPPPGSTPNPTGESPPPPVSGDPAFRLPGHAAHLNSFTCKLVMAFFSFFTHYFIFHN